MAPQFSRRGFLKAGAVADATAGLSGMGAVPAAADERPIRERPGRRTGRLSAIGMAAGLLGAMLASVSSAQAAENAGHAYYAAPAGHGTACTAADPCQLTTARDLARTEIPAMTGDVVINLQGGVYHLRSPLTFTTGDSGENGHQVIWRAAPGARPVLSGGYDVHGWSLFDRSRGIWRAHVPAWAANRQFYVNGQREHRASGPASLLGAITQTGTGYKITDTAIDQWPNVTDTEFVYTGSAGARASWQAWTERRCGIAAVQGDTVTMKQPCYAHATSFGVQSVGLPTSVENNLALLNEPGEWYLDTASHYLYYKPRPHQDLAAAKTVIPASQGLLRGDGTPDQPIHDITVSGLTFQYNSWGGPSGDAGFPDIQADVYLDASGNSVLPPGAVAFHAAHRMTFTDNTLKHLGGQGLVLDDGSQNNLVAGNAITDTSANGIDIGTVTTPNPPADAADAGNTVRDNYLFGLPSEYHGGVGIFAGYVKNTVISHNEIADTPYTGITLGWGWGAASDLGNNHIDSNYAHNVMSSSLLDGGAIYTNGPHSPSPRSTINGNYVTGDPEPYGELYLDGSVSNYDVTGNVVANTPTNWIYIQTIAGQVAKYNKVTGNYTDTSTISSNWDPSNTVSGNHTGLTTWPPQAQRIMRSAGLDAR